MAAETLYKYLPQQLQIRELPRARGGFAIARTGDNDFAAGFVLSSGTIHVESFECDLFISHAQTQPQSLLRQTPPVAFPDFLDDIPLAKVTMLASERTIARFWDTPEEDEAWQNL